MNSTPSLADLLRRSGAALLDGMHVTLPAVVERYDPDRQCVDAQPTTTQEVRGEDGRLVTERLPVVTNAPVLFPGSGQYRITWPIEVGSVVVLHFTSVALDRWLSLGGEGVAPQDGRRHDLSSAFATPGGHSFAGSTTPGTAAPTDALVLHAPAGGLVRVGGPEADDPVVRMSDLQYLIDKYNGHTHPTPSGVSSAPGASLIEPGSISGSPDVMVP